MIALFNLFHFRITPLTAVMALLIGGVACEQGRPLPPLLPPQGASQPGSHFLNHPAFQGKWRLHSAQCVPPIGSPIAVPFVEQAEKRRCLFDDLKTMMDEGFQKGATGDVNAALGIHPDPDDNRAWVTAALAQNVVSFEFEVVAGQDQLTLKALKPGGGAFALPPLKATPLQTYDAFQAERSWDILKTTTTREGKTFLRLSPKINATLKSCPTGQMLQMAFEKGGGEEDLFYNAGLTGTWAIKQYATGARGIKNIDPNARESILPAVLIAKFEPINHQAKKDFIHFPDHQTSVTDEQIIRFFDSKEATQRGLATKLEVTAQEATWSLTKHQTTKTIKVRNPIARLTEKKLGASPPILIATFLTGFEPKLLNTKIGSVTLGHKEDVKLILEKQENRFPEFLNP